VQKLKSAKNVSFVSHKHYDLRNALAVIELIVKRCELFASSPKMGRYNASKSRDLVRGGMIRRYESLRAV
jgi:hypothetical protein